MNKPVLPLWSLSHGKAAATALVALAVCGLHAPTAAQSVVASAAPSSQAAGVTAESESAVALAPETRLAEIYRLIGAGHMNTALEQATRLAQDYPNFQLAQLVLGDLLATRARALRSPGDVPDSLSSIKTPAPVAKSRADQRFLDLRQPGQRLADLRHESEARISALRERPPEGAVPVQFLALSPRNRHAIAVDASRSRLYLFENDSEKGPRLIADYYVSVGKSGVEKTIEGDSRTPLGVYFIVKQLRPGELHPFYGSGALPINYPNKLDLQRGKTGGGIWLHGTPRRQYARAPLATDGCIVLANPDLETIFRTVAPVSTPVLIAARLDWVPTDRLQAARQPFEEVLAAWRSAKESGDLDRLLDFYAPDFRNNDRTLTDWKPRLRQEINQAAGRPISLKNLSLLRWQDEAETMVVTFDEVQGNRRAGPVKRQYWMRQGNGWKIFYEGIIG